MSHVIKSLLLMIFLSLIVNVIGVADPMFNSGTQLGKSDPVQTTPIGDGFFEFRSNVEGAGVFLDDQRVGTIHDGILKVPVQVYDKTIQHQLRIEAPGYSSYQETLVQNPKVGETKVVRGILQVLPLNLTGTLSLAVSPPGSTVSVDNISVGVIGQSGIMTLRTVKSGSRLVRVTMP
ncbi:MAG: PEGA domain-containing protein, partial [Methanospirillum sp.]|uniref:PEGA domain-containing protein n=1 Tax=Methanospirillum sp. TaxID=45200 RepID=UPI00236B31C2